MGFSVRIYRSLAGSYLALLLGPAFPALAAMAGVTGYQWPLFSVGALLAGGVGYLVASKVDMVQWLTTQWVAIVVTIVPLWYVVWLIAILAHNPGKVLLTIVGRPSTLGASAFGIGLLAVVLASRHQTVERLNDATVYASFTAGPARRRRRIRYAAFAIALGAVGGLLVAISIEGAATKALLLAAVLILPLSVVGLVSTHQRQVVITDEGLAIDGTFTEWMWFDSYEVTDQSLVLSFGSHLFGDIALDVTDIPSVDTVRDVLEEQVPDST